MDKRSANNVTGAQSELHETRQKQVYSFSPSFRRPHQWLLEMSSVSKSPREHFNRGVLADLHTWLFEGLAGRYDMQLPEATLQPWFRSGPDVDEYCRSV
jgi:hypothetical protein